MHVGQPSPSEAKAESEWPTRRHRRPSWLEHRIEWQKLGVEPRWLGMETSDCAVALEPSVFYQHGADELQRFLAGARARGETALVVVTVGHASVMLPGVRNVITGHQLPAGMRPALAGDLDPPERDLGMRLLNRPADAPWWGVRVGGIVFARGDGGPTITNPPEGELRSILVDGLGDPVVAVWSTSAGDQRWYIVPDATDWGGMVDWLIRQALPAYVPDALRRVRSPRFVDPALQTQAELTARQALADMTARHAAEEARLEDVLERARVAAEPIRYGLLYGTNRELVAAVEAVLTAAGFTTVNLDEELGGTRSADLLATFERHRRLVEIKSASGNASEDLVGDLLRHLATWPELRPHTPVGGGVLIVNHQHRREPFQRSAQVYSRPEFVTRLTVPVIGTRTLFDRWRVADWATVRAAVLGSAPSDELDVSPPAPSGPPAPAPTPQRRPRSRWRPWRRGGHD